MQNDAFTTYDLLAPPKSWPAIGQHSNLLHTPIIKQANSDYIQSLVKHRIYSAVSSYHLMQQSLTA